MKEKMGIPRKEEQEGNYAIDALFHESWSVEQA